MVTRKGVARGPYAKTAARRAEILAVARDLFMRTGFHGTSFRQIAEATGLSQAGLAHHFASKDELLLALLEQRDLDHVAASTDDHGLALLDGLRRILAEAHENPTITQLFTSLTAEATNPDYPGREFFVRRYRRVRGTFTQELTAGGVDAIPPASAAMLLAAVMDGLQIQWLLDDELDIESVFADFIRLLTASAHVTPPREKRGDHRTHLKT